MAQVTIDVARVVGIFNYADKDDFLPFNASQHGNLPATIASPQTCKRKGYSYINSKKKRKRKKMQTSALFGKLIHRPPSLSVAPVTQPLCLTRRWRLAP